MKTAVAGSRQTSQVATASAEWAARSALARYAYLVTAAAILVLLVGTVRYPVAPTIGLDLPGLGTQWKILFGTIFWVVFAFAGSLRARVLPGGAVITFHMPFVVAGTILGGPVVGAWMGIVSQFELREARAVPWYGVVGNHAIIVIAAVASGVLGQLIGLALGSMVPGEHAFATLAMGLGVAIGFTSVNVALVLPIVSLRSGVGLRSAFHSYDAMLRTTLVAETVLAWLMAVTYLTVAWWAPLLCVALVLVIWETHDQRERGRHDELTGLLNPAGYLPMVRASLFQAAHAGHRHALLVIDLDDFGIINKDHGADVGDEMIRAAARRMEAAVRRTDVVGRQNRAGDEFLILLADVPDEETARMLAWRIQERIREPLQVRGSELSVSVGASIGIAMLEPWTTLTLAKAQRLADRRMQHAKRNRLGVVAEPDEAVA